MTKGQESVSEMAHARKSDGINVIFDQDAPPTPSPTRSQSRSSCGSSRSSGSDRRARGIARRSYRSSSSSDSSRSRSHSRSRSRPRCHRRSSRCRCAGHNRHDGVRRHGPPPRRYRAHSRSCSHSRSPDRSPRHRRYRSHSRSDSVRTHKRDHVRAKTDGSSSRTNRRSRSSERLSVSSSGEDNTEQLSTTEVKATKILGLEQLELPESVMPVLEKQSPEIRETSPLPEAWVRPDPVPQKTSSQSSEEDPDEDLHSPILCPQRKIISFSIHNSVAKPTHTAPTGVKVIPRVDSYEGRRPYGHWVPVKKQKSVRRKHSH